MLENNVLSITQDKYGFIWIATTVGVNKYDGQDFSNFRSGQGSISLSNNYAQYLLPDCEGNIWIATSHGLNVYRYDTDSIQIIYGNASKEGCLSSNDLICFAPSKSKNGIWVAPYDSGVNFYDYSKQIFVRMNLPDEMNWGNLTYIYEDSRQNLWIGTLNNGVFRYSLSQGGYIHYPVGRVSHIVEDSQGTIWISAGTLHYQPKNDKRLHMAAWDHVIPNDIRCVVENKDGQLWIGGNNRLGYIDLASVSGKLEFHLNEIYQQGLYLGKSFSNIIALYCDKDNNLWIGTYGHGLYMRSGEDKIFNSIRFNPLDKSSISGNKIQAIAYNRKNGETALSVENVGVDIFDKENRRVRSYLYSDRAQNGLSNPFIVSLLYDNEENLWVGTSQRGIDILPKKSRKFNHLQSLPSQNIRALVQGMQGQIWIGTENGLYSVKNGKVNDDFVQHSSRRYDIRSVVQTDDHSVWLGTYGDGLLFYDLRDHSITKHLPSNNSSAYYIWQLKAYGDSICLSARDGIHLFSIRQKKYSGWLNKSNGMVSNDFTALEMDRKGNLWAASNEGISYITPEKTTLFTAEHGVLQNHFFTSCQYEVSNGNTVFYFAGYDGVNIFLDHPVGNLPTKSPIYIHSLKLFGKEIRPCQDIPFGNPLSQSMINTNSIELEHNQSTFSIGFIAPAYGWKDNHYSYILEGGEQHWNDIKEREVTFRDLPYGHYTLKIRKKNAPENVAQLAITVHPPFWLTTEAYLIYVLLLVSVLYMVWRMSMLRIKARHRIILEKSEKEKEEEIYQAKMRFFTNISHEIRTPLTLILVPLESMDYQRFPEIANTLDLITRNARRLLQLVNQLLDFRKTEMKGMKLKVHYGNLTQHLQQISYSFESFKNEKHIDFSFTSSPMNLSGWYDGNFMEKIMFNLLSNAYKFTPDGGEISIELRLIKEENQNKVQVKVKDTGCGISKEEQLHIFERFYQSDNSVEQNKMGSGIGLHLTHNLVSLHHGTIRVESEPDKGAKFIVVLPCDKSFYEDAEIAEGMPENTDNKSVEEENSDASQSNETDERITVLIVDDDQDMRSYLKTLLSARYHVLTAENGEAALDVLKQQECDIVVSDVMMDEMDGMELCKQIKMNIETSHIPVILLTAKSSMESRIEGLENGADSYITKPFNYQHLFIRIEKLIEFRRIFKEKFSQMSGYNITHITTQSIDNKLLQDMTNYIGKNLGDTELNGDKIAKEFCLSRMTLHRKIKSLTSYSISEYVRAIRLKEAAYQIENSNKNISDICYEVGFNSPSHFTTCFIKQYKETPTEYLKHKRPTASGC